MPPSNSALPRKLKRHSATAASAPSTTLTIVDSAAMVSELPNAVSIDSLVNALTYQSVVKPRQTILRLESLKLKATRVISGRYRNSPTMISHSCSGQRRR